jgi:membrane-associated phospholipid phosphatase
LVLTYLLRHHVVWIATAVLLLGVTWHQWTLRRLSLIVASALVLVAGYACVWNANYLFARLTAPRLIDARLVAIDRALLGGVKYEGLFPLVTDPMVFRLLENSYAMLFPQILAGVILASMTTSRRFVARWLGVLFTAYAIGLASFMVAPAVGPPIFAPESLSPEYRETFTGTLMGAMREEYFRLQDGRGPLNGFGYFVALPSLHAAGSVLVQASFRHWPLIYWTWMPVTVLLIISTFALGYHYFIDVPIGVLIGIWLARGLPRAERWQTELIRSDTRGPALLDN